MKNVLLKILPWTAITSLLVFSICLVYTITQRSEILIENDETRLAVESVVSKLQKIHPVTINDQDFLNELEATDQMPYIATVWLFNTKGDVVYAAGSTSQSFSRGNVSQRATDETKRILASLPEASINDDQRLEILAASAIQAEGEHNDIYHHMLRVISSPAGTKIAYLGIAYEINPRINKPDSGYIFSLLISLACFIAYWCSLVVWVFLDAQKRNERAWVWSIFVFTGNFVALLAYLLVRHPEMDKTNLLR